MSAATPDADRRSRALEELRDALNRRDAARLNLNRALALIEDRSKTLWNLAPEVFRVEVPGRVLELAGDGPAAPDVQAAEADEEVPEPGPEPEAEPQVEPEPQSDPQPQPEPDPEPIQPLPEAATEAAAEDAEDPTEERRGPGPDWVDAVAYAAGLGVLPSEVHRFVNSGVICGGAMILADGRRRLFLPSLADAQLAAHGDHSDARIVMAARERHQRRVQSPTGVVELPPTAPPLPPEAAEQTDDGKPYTEATCLDVLRKHNKLAFRQRSGPGYSVDGKNLSADQMITMAGDLIAADRQARRVNAALLKAKAS